MSDDADGPATLERYILVGEPTIVAMELHGSEAARTALLELAMADAVHQADLDDDPITREFAVRRYTNADFDPELIDALVALDGDSGSGDSGDTGIVFDEPVVDLPGVSLMELAMMDRLREPFVDFMTVAAL